MLDCLPVPGGGPRSCFDPESPPSDFVHRKGVYPGGCGRVAEGIWITVGTEDTLLLFIVSGGSDTILGCGASLVSGNGQCPNMSINSWSLSLAWAASSSVWKSSSKISRIAWVWESNTTQLYPFHGGLFLQNLVCPFCLQLTTNWQRHHGFDLYGAKQKFSAFR